MRNRRVRESENGEKEQGEKGRMETSDISRKCCDSEDETTRGERNWEKIPVCVAHSEPEQRRPDGTDGTVPCEGFAAGNDTPSSHHTVQRLLLLQRQTWLKNPRRRPTPPRADDIFCGRNIIAIKGIGEMGHEGYLKLPNSFETNNWGHARSLRKETRRPSYLSLQR